MKAQPIKKAERGLQRAFEREFADLELARDEIRLAIHLASMDAKATWRNLEKSLDGLGERVAQEGDHVTEATRSMAKELRQSLKELSASL